MKKPMKVLLIAGAVLVGLTGMSSAVDFVIQAQMPRASQYSVALHKLTGACTNPATPTAACDFATQTGTAINFGTLAFYSGTTNGTAYQYFAPTTPHLYAIDVATTGGGGGALSVTMSYTDTARPAAQLAANGLGKKMSIAYSKVVGTTETSLQTKRVLDGLNTTVPSSSLNGGYFRAYVGIITDPTGVTNAQVFGTGDADGIYTGRLVVTATV